MADEAAIDWGCCVVILGIAPLGIKTARIVGLPSVLIENFTWDWIYRGCADHYPQMVEHGDYFASIMAISDLQLQRQPVCRPISSAVPTAPVSRRNWKALEKICNELGIESGRKMVLVSTGGTGHKLALLDTLGTSMKCYRFCDSRLD
jgi:hypothetical protein